MSCFRFSFDFLVGCRLHDISTPLSRLRISGCKATVSFCCLVDAVFKNMRKRHTLPGGSISRSLLSRVGSKAWQRGDPW